MFELAEKLGRLYVPRSLAPPLKTVIAYPRYYVQMAASRFAPGAGHGPAHPLLIVGLPKSGSSWLTAMVAALSRRREVSVPEAVLHGYRHLENHTFQIRGRRFGGLELGRVVCKFHFGPSHGNVRAISELADRSVVIHRDLRDVAVSYVHYVRRTAYHPEHREMSRGSIGQSLDLFIERWLPDYRDWVLGWTRLADDPTFLMVRYEDLLRDPLRQLTSVAAHLGTPADEGTLARVVREYSFSELSGGRRTGESDPGSFFRKGVAGDWRSQFSDKQLHAFYRITGLPDSASPLFWE